MPSDKSPNSLNTFTGPFRVQPASSSDHSYLPPTHPFSLAQSPNSPGSFPIFDLHMSRFFFLPEKPSTSPLLLLVQDSTQMSTHPRRELLPPSFLVLWSSCVLSPISSPRASCHFPASLPSLTHPQSLSPPPTSPSSLPGPLQAPLPSSCHLFYLLFPPTVLGRTTQCSKCL